MPRTRISGTEIQDNAVTRDDLDVSTTGKAVVRRIIAGTGVTIGSTGVDSGTGDVTINSTGGGSGSPGGVDRSVQFNNNGVFAGFGTWINNLLSIAGSLFIEGDNTSVAVATFKPPALHTTNTIEVQDDTGAVVTAIRPNGTLEPASTVDANVVNRSLYQSEDNNTLCFKDQNGNLYLLYNNHSETFYNLPMGV